MVTLIALLTVVIAYPTSFLLSVSLIESDALALLSGAIR